jgi:DNA-binding response OmpR family regulator
MLTAGGRDTDREKAEEAGVDEFMTKPFSPSALRARVKEILGDP